MRRGRYFITSISPILFNLGFIVGALFLGAIVDGFRPDLSYNEVIDSNLLGLAIGVVSGGVVQLCFQFYFVFLDRRDVFKLFQSLIFLLSNLKPS